MGKDCLPHREGLPGQELQKSSHGITSNNSDSGIEFRPRSKSSEQSTQTSLDQRKTYIPSTKGLTSHHSDSHEAGPSQKISVDSRNGPDSSATNQGSSGKLGLSTQAYYDLHTSHLKLKDEHSKLMKMLQDTKARFEALKSEVGTLEDDRGNLSREKRRLREENRSLREAIQNARSKRSTKTSSVSRFIVSSEGGRKTKDTDMVHEEANENEIWALLTDEADWEAYIIGGSSSSESEDLEDESDEEESDEAESEEDEEIVKRTRAVYPRPVFPPSSFSKAHRLEDEFEAFKYEDELGSILPMRAKRAVYPRPVFPLSSFSKAHRLEDESEAVKYEDDSEDDSEEDSEEEEDENELGSILPMRAIALPSEAYGFMLKDESGANNSGDDSEEDEDELVSTVSMQIDPSSSEAEVSTGRSDKIATTATLQDDRPLSEDFPTANASLLSRASMLWQKITSFLVSVGLQERNVLPGHQRIRWKNAYGQMLYDDYKELEPGGIKALEAYLNSAAYRSHHHSSTIQVPATSSLPKSDTQTGLPGSRNTSDQISNSLPVKSRFLEDLERGNSSSDGEEKSSGTLDLIVCVGRGYKDELLPESVIHIENDQQLFRALRDSYKAHVGRTRRICSLKTVGSIHFMMLGYGGPGDLEVRCHNDLCHELKCHCIPPVELVGSEYLCNPVPTPLSPPVGPRLMMSFFTDPDAMNPNQRRILNQLPKRTSGNLDSNYAEGVTKAWGIYYEEDWNWAKIWWILGLAFFPPSFLFGILWGVLKQDIQGAFGVASWWMAGASIVIGIVGTSTWAK